MGRSIPTFQTTCDVTKPKDCHSFKIPLQKLQSKQALDSTGFLTSTRAFVSGIRENFGSKWIFSFLRFVNGSVPFQRNGKVDSFVQTAHDVIKIEELHSFKIPLELLQSKQALR
jgi:hypothetical protein